MLKILRGLFGAFTDARIRALCGVLLSLILIASWFYHVVEGWRWINSLYFAVIAISTVGFGDFAPQTDAGKIFTIAYLLCGLGLFVSVASALADRIKSETIDTETPGLAGKQGREGETGA